MIELRESDYDELDKIWILNLKEFIQIRAHVVHVWTSRRIRFGRKNIVLVVNSTCT